MFDIEVLRTDRREKYCHSHFAAADSYAAIF
jgi:hypothetical protein